MADPKLDDGFVQIALDLFVGLMTSDLPNKDAIVLSWVLVQSYGPNKRRDVHIDPAEVEEYTGLHRNNVRGSVRRLVEAGYLHRNEDGSYRFQKDWEMYRPGKERFIDRLGGGLRRFALATKTHPMFMKRSKRVAIHRDCPIDDDLNPERLSTTDVGNPTGLGSEPEPQSKWIASAPDATDGSVGANGVADSRSVAPRVRRPAPDSENSEVDRDTHTSRTPETPALRTPEDQAKVEEAIGILTADLETHALGMELSRSHNRAALLPLEGWRWVHAAYVIQGPNVRGSKRTSFSYLTTIARNVVSSEAITSRAVPKPGGAPSANGEAPAPPRPRKLNSGERFAAGVPAMLAKLDAEGFDWTTGKTERK